MMEVMLKPGNVLHTFEPKYRKEILKIMTGEIKIEDLSENQLGMMAFFDDLGGVDLFRDFSRLAKGSKGVPKSK
jgi:hypothetical protein